MNQKSQKERQELLSDLGLDDNAENDQQESEVEQINEKSEREIIQDKQRIALQEFQEKHKQKGVCYISRIPPYMSVAYMRRLLEPYGIERMYLVPEDESKHKMRKQMGGNKRKSFTEGWVEFSDKRIAKRTALTLNCTSMVPKKHNFYESDLWCIKYLSKFKWENLTQKFAYEERVRKEKLKVELAQSKKEHDFYDEKKYQSKMVLGMRKRKAEKGLDESDFLAKKRQFEQRAPLKKQE